MRIRPTRIKRNTAPNQKEEEEVVVVEEVMVVVEVKVEVVMVKVEVEVVQEEALCVGDKSADVRHHSQHLA